MTNQVSHINVEDEDGQVICPVDTSKGSCFSTWAMPRQGDKIQIDDRMGEWEVVDVIHTLTTGTSAAPVSLRVREVSNKVTEDS
ncbi:MAG: hypothetical protein ACAH88_19260 [Roseimicrobium sp.]